MKALSIFLKIKNSRLVLLYHLILKLTLNCSKTHIEMVKGKKKSVETRGDSSEETPESVYRTVLRTIHGGLKVEKLVQKEMCVLFRP